MKTEKEIAALVEATLAVADEVQTAPVPAELKEKILDRVFERSAPPMRVHWLRPALTAAAAVIILAVNVFTIRHITQSRPPLAGVGTTDPVDEIRSAYALDGLDNY